MTSLPLLTVLILTKNEALNLPHALESLAPLGAKIVIVDSGSTDGTLDIARQHGCEVTANPFVSHAQQLNWAIDTLSITTPWIMRLDADERLTPELAREIPGALARASEHISGFELKRRVYFWGTWIRHGGYYPTWLLRIWRRGSGRLEERWMDEHVVLSGGRVARLSHDIIDENHKGLGYWVEKHNGYADREVLDLLAQRQGNEAGSGAPDGQAGRRRWLKTNVYAKTPLFLRAALYWLWRYVFRLGFLDGRAGLVFHFMQGFWYRMLIDAKLYEALKKTHDK